MRDCKPDFNAMEVNKCILIIYSLFVDCNLVFKCVLSALDFLSFDTLDCIFLSTDFLATYMDIRECAAKDQNDEKNEIYYLKTPIRYSNQ